MQQMNDGKFWKYFLCDLKVWQVQLEKIENKE